MDSTSKQARQQVKRDKVLLQDAVQKFENATDDAKRIEARGAVERVALKGTRIRITAPTASERNEFAQIVSELSRNPGIVGLHGIKDAVEHAATRLGIDKPSLPSEVLERLNKLV